MFGEKNSESGFTLIEMLVCLLILFFLVMAVPHLQPILKSSFPKKFSAFEWTLYLEQIQMEFREAQQVSVYDRKLVLHDENGILVSHVIQGNYLVRKVNDKGNEILLQNVKNISYELLPAKLIVHVEDVNNERHIGSVTRFHSLEGGT